MRIYVSKKDIELGELSKCKACPIFLALKRAGYANLYVEYQGLYEQAPVFRAAYRFTPKANSWHRTLMEKGKQAVKPTTLYFKKAKV